MRTEQLLSFLLSYPDAEALGARAEVAAAAAALPSSPARESIHRFLAAWAATPAAELQRDYVATFDFSTRTSLHLTYHQYGDQRRRGVALLRLKRLYAEAGLPLDGPELPDYLPVMLEFAALAPAGAAAEPFDRVRPALELVRSRLHELDSPYAHLLDATVALLPRLTQAQRRAARRLAAVGPPSEQVGLEPFPAAPGQPDPLAPPEVMPPIVPTGGAR